MSMLFRFVDVIIDGDGSGIRILVLKEVLGRTGAGRFDLISSSLIGVAELSIITSLFPFIFC